MRTSKKWKTTSINFFKWKTTSKKMKMEDDFNKTEIKWKTNQSTKINLIGCDTIVNSPSVHVAICRLFTC